MSDITSITALVGAITGVMGVCFGGISLWRQHDTNRVKLRVVPKIGYELNPGWMMSGTSPTPDGVKLFNSNRPKRFCIEVVNLSSFEVTIDEVGFNNGRNSRSVLPPDLLLPQEKTWPARLKPREAVSVYSSPWPKSQFVITKNCKAYATTDCGITRYGRSPIFKPRNFDEHTKSAA
jgi:hypothetical protein